MSTQQEDFEAIRQLKARYFRLMDTKQWDDWADCFCDDVTAVYEGAPRANKDDDPEKIALQGKETLVKGVPSLLAPNVKSMHQGFMPELELTSETTATGIWAMYDYLRLPKCTFQGWGHYHETYRKEADGKWRIASIHLTRVHVEETWQGI